MVKISAPLVPCASKESAIERDIIRKKKRVNCVYESVYLMTPTLRVSVTQKSNTSELS